MSVLRAIGVLCIHRYIQAESFSYVRVYLVRSVYAYAHAYTWVRLLDMSVYARFIVGLHRLCTDMAWALLNR